MMQSTRLNIYACFLVVLLSCVLAVSSFALDTGYDTALDDIVDNTVKNMKIYDYKSVALLDLNDFQTKKKSAKSDAIKKDLIDRLSLKAGDRKVYTGEEASVGEGRYLEADSFLSGTVAVFPEEIRIEIQLYVISLEEGKPKRKWLGTYRIPLKGGEAQNSTFFEEKLPKMQEKISDTFSMREGSSGEQPYPFLRFDTRPYWSFFMSSLRSDEKEYALVNGALDMYGLGFRSGMIGLSFSGRSSRVSSFDVKAFATELYLCLPFELGRSIDLYCGAGGCYSDITLGNVALKNSGAFLMAGASFYLITSREGRLGITIKQSKIYDSLGQNYMQFTVGLELGGI